MFKGKTVVLILLWILMIGFSLLTAQTLTVYPPVPGLAESEFYTFRVRQAGSGSWMTPFAFITRCVESTPKNDASKYYSQWIGGWSNTYINFEMASSIQVEIEISKKNGSNITKAAAHPQHKVISCNVVDGKAYVVVDNPALFAVDIDGQMDDQNTGRLLPDGWGDESLYSGPPIHTVTIFANPMITDKPSVSDSDVYAVSPGEPVPETGSWSTLYFKPGVHDVGKNFQVHTNKNYYIPGDAIVYGALNNNTNSGDGANIRIFGHGTLSGARIPHPADDGAREGDYFRYRPIDIRGAKNTDVEGITIADSPFHTLMVSNSYDPANPCYVRWVKIFTWRANGDGINPFGNVGIEDCFIRTQDDCVYTNGLGMRRIVFWTDVNGSAFVLSPVGKIANPNLIIEDCDIIYSRSVFTPGGRGGCMFNLRGDGGPTENNHKLTFRNIRGEDSRPTRTSFNLRVANDTKLREAPGAVTNIVWKDITIAGTSIIGDHQTIHGHTGAPLHDLVFDNVVIAGELIDDINDFDHNGYVYDLIFLPLKNNLITNGDFTTGDLTGWVLAAVPPSAATGSVADGECFVDITHDDSTDSHIKLSQDNLHLENDTTYALSFDARAERPRTLILEIKSGSNTALQKTFHIETFPKTYSVSFKNELTTANDYEFQFFLGSQGNNNVWIDNVGLASSLPYHVLTTSATNGKITPIPLRDTYLSGTVVELTATGDLGYVFSSWSGDLSGTNNPAKITMDADKNVTANFTSAPIYTLTTKAKGGTILLDPPGPQYTAGTKVIVKAVGYPDYIFSGWSGDPLNAPFYINPNSITINSDKSITANFIGPPEEPGLWVETFTFSDGTTVDTGSTAWTTTRSSGHFQVMGNRLALNDAGPLGVFTTGVIDISGGAVNVSVDVVSEGGLEGKGHSSEDYFGLFIIVDGGAEQFFYENYGAQSDSTISKTGISGSTLVIVIKGYVTFNSEYYYFDDLKVTESDPSNIDVTDISLPTSTQLVQNYPNPFNSETTILYQLSEATQVKVVIYNSIGALVATLVDGHQSAGHYSIKWKAQDDKGHPVASGIYIYRLETAKTVQMKKFVLLQ